MSDYYDGCWHGWNGGECPVHPETIIDVCLYDDGEVTGETGMKACNTLRAMLSFPHGKTGIQIGNQTRA